MDAGILLLLFMRCSITAVLSLTTSAAKNPGQPHCCVCQSDVFTDLGFPRGGYADDTAKAAPNSQDDVLSSSLSLPIQHSLQTGRGAEFSERGFLNFRSLSQGLGSYRQSNELTLDDSNRLKELATEDGLYRARVPTQLLSLQTSDDIGYVSSYVKACSLLESNMSDEITIHADQSGHVLGISILPLRGTCTKTADEIWAMDALTFNTTVSLSLVVQGPVPDTQAYLDKLEEEKMQKKANGSDNRSFLAKYWMYIVPVVLFLMISGGGQGS